MTSILAPKRRSPHHHSIRHERVSICEYSSHPSIPNGDRTCTCTPLNPSERSGLIQAISVLHVGITPSRRLQATSLDGVRSSRSGPEAQHLFHGVFRYSVIRDVPLTMPRGCGKSPLLASTREPRTEQSGSGGHREVSYVCYCYFYQDTPYFTD